ncbi:FtsX-like permease family protein [Vagococcus fluvialis]|uniref:FtsX-like permease family protein n=1 Tax=Vagococcus fluvialis TaxID=2738 RepID=UPI003B593ADE
MNKKALRKSNTREIFGSKARFLSILLIIFLGVCFYAGIKATGPDMINTADTYYKKQQLMDTKVVSTYGLEDKDLKLIKDNKNVKQAEGSYTIDVVEKKENLVFRLMSYDVDNKNRLNNPVLVDGSLPKKSGEIALDNRATELKKYKIGDKITLDDEDNLSQSEYTIVGIVKSPLYIDQVSRGNTTVGKGSIDLFGLVPESDIKMDVWTEIYVSYKNTKDEVSYTSSYENKVEKNQKELENELDSRITERYDKIQADGQKSISEASDKIANGEKELISARDAIEQGKKELATQKDSLTLAESMGQPVPAEMKAQLVSAENNLNEQDEKLKTEEEKLAKNKADLKEKEDELKELAKPEYMYRDRNTNPAYSEYKDNADRISSIATVFPVFFFMIAALICLTTMTRMVDEKRGEIGTLKALGYSNFEIAQKFIIYATLASIIGSLLGLVVGFNVFPTVIFNAYGTLYNLPSVIITYYTSYSLQSVAVALVCTLVSAMVVLRVDLLSTPAVLMRPKAPKPGKRILLEKIPFIWSKLNFNQKVTARNLFRYKQRMLMTVLGIAGCMAMIITGFGLKDSIGDIVDLQFSKIWQYDATVTYNPDATDEESQNYLKVRDDLKEVSNHLGLSQKTVEVTKKGYTKQEVVIDTPKDTKSFKEFIVFKDRKTDETYKLDDTGVIINEKLANLFDVESGDLITIKTADDEIKGLKVKAISENYAMHFIYMTPKFYEETFGKAPEYNVDLLKFKEKLTESEEEKLAETLMDTKKAINVSFTSQIGKAMDDTMGSLNIVVWVLIISAAMLAFIVLYNLTNINISERIRELSTIKVLGFYDKEVTMYVYRENNILTLLGILLGCVLGKLLHGFVIKTAEVDLMMFPPDIHFISYVYSAILTLLFSTVVMFVMHRRLRKVDMIEALKSTE